MSETASKPRRQYAGYRPARLGKQDRRTWQARLLVSTRADLTRHAGGSPSATQGVLIERAAQIAVRLAAMDKAFAETGTMSEHATRTYLAWSNALRRAMAELGMAAAAPRQPTLAEHLAARDRHIAA